MFDYSAWLQRANEFVAKRVSPRFPEEAKQFIAPPLSDAEIEELAAKSRLPIPPPLRRFWREAAAWCKLKYWNELSPVFEQVVEAAYSEDMRGHPVISGGVEMDQPESVISGDFSWMIEYFQHEFPKDARFWQHSLPVFPLTNGDYIGLYLRDEAIDPPGAYLCHEGCGASDIIAPSFDDFLIRWEQLGYIFLDDLLKFCDPHTGLLQPENFPVEFAAIQSILQGIPRTDLRKPPPAMTEAQWLSETEPGVMLRWLERAGHFKVIRRPTLAKSRKQRLFACACCRRIWDRLGPLGRQAIEVSERFAEGLATSKELSQARESLCGSSRTLTETLTIHQSEGFYWIAAINAVDADQSVSFWILRHLDEPELSIEKQAQCDLLRQFFGNPFQRERAQK